MQDQWKLDSCTLYYFDKKSCLLRLYCGDGRQLHADAQILGSWDTGKNFWEWAWNNPNASPVTSRDSATVREIGNKYSIAYLQAGVVPVPDKKYVTYLCAIGLRATDSIGLYIAKADSIEVMIMLKDPRWAKVKEMAWDDEPIAITVPEVVAGQSSILLVIHDFGHGGWQFLDGADMKGRKPAVITKDKLLILDPSVAELKDLPAGWRARRTSPQDRWIREKSAAKN